MKLGKIEIEFKTKDLRPDLKPKLWLEGLKNKLVSIVFKIPIGKHK